MTPRSPLPCPPVSCPADLKQGFSSLVLSWRLVPALSCFPSTGPMRATAAMQRRRQLGAPQGLSWETHNALAVPYLVLPPCSKGFPPMLINTYVPCFLIALFLMILSMPVPLLSRLHCHCAGFGWSCVHLLHSIQPGAVVWICAGNDVGSTGMVLCLLSSGCTVPGPALLLTLPVSELSGCAQRFRSRHSWDGSPQLTQELSQTSTGLWRRLGREEVLLCEDWQDADQLRGEQLLAFVSFWSPTSVSVISFLLQLWFVFFFPL